MERLTEIGEKMGYEEKELQRFVSEQQALEREERQNERELKKMEAEEKEAQRRHELQMKRLETGDGEGRRFSPTGGDSVRKVPKLPSFVEGKDELDS